MSIVTVINQDSGQAVSIENDRFGETITPWFPDSDPLSSVRTDREAEIYRARQALTEIIESDDPWTAEDIEAPAADLDLIIEKGAAFAEVEIDADHGVDTIVVIAPESGDEITRIQIDASEDQEPYDDALRAAGFTEFTWQ